MLIDSHCHLEGPKFDADRDDVLTRAHQAGVETILLIGSGTGPGTYDCALQLATTRGATNPPRLYATLGLHPHEAKLASQADYDEMGKLANEEKIIAWGEIGLDYHYDHS